MKDSTPSDHSYLGTKLIPLPKVLASLAPFHLQSTSRHHPNRSIAVVANTLVLLGDGELVIIAHDTVVEVSSLRKIDKFDKLRKLSLFRCFTFFATGWKRWFQLETGNNFKCSVLGGANGLDFLLFGAFLGS